MTVSETRTAKFPKYLREAFAAFPNVVSNRGIMSGAPCVASRRIAVWVIAGRYAAGESVGFIAQDYNLKLTDVTDAIRFACWTGRLRNIKFWKFYEVENEKQFATSDQLRDRRIKSADWNG